MLRTQDSNAKRWCRGIATMALATSLGACTIVDEGELVEEELDVDQAAAALTVPAPGAVAKPSTFLIEPPWQDGLRRTIINGYGTGHHQHTNSATQSNDYYALDFDMWLDEAVHPVAPGTVVYAGFATGGWAGYGRIVFIDHGNGHQSLYAHLNSVEVAAGAYVGTTTRLGGAGNSGTSQVHLHLALYKNASFQNSPSGIGPYGGQAVVPEPFSFCVKKGSGSCENLLWGDALVKRTTTSCPYQSVQSRFRRDSNKAWGSTLSIAQDKSFQVAAFYNAWGLLATNFTSIAVRRPDGVVFRPPNLGVVTPSMPGTYSVQATCGSLTETMFVDVIPKSCPYGSIQARVHRDISQPWMQAIDISYGQSFEVAAFRDHLGVYAADTTYAINVIGPNGYTLFRHNADVITPPARGTYHVRATCSSLSEVAIVNVH